MKPQLHCRIELTEKPSDTRVEKLIAETLLKLPFVVGVIFDREG